MVPGLDAESQDAVIRRLLGALPEGAGIMLMGNTAGMAQGVPHVTRTKDVDVTIILLDERRRVAPIEAIRQVIATLGLKAETAPDDHSWIKAHMEIGGEKRQVDFIRGKSRDRPDGTFIDRRTLERVTAKADERGRVFLPSATDLVVMKAWAAVDQARHLRDASENVAWHEGRRRAYEEDARRYTEFALDRGVLDVARINEHLARMAAHRRAEVRGVLLRAGALTA